MKKSESIISNKDNGKHKIDGLRTSIDQIDHDLLNLLNRRLTLVDRIGKLKQHYGMPVYDPLREERILKKIKDLNQGPAADKDLLEVFRTMMSLSRKRQVLFGDGAESPKTTELFGVFGHPVAHSLSPAMHNRAFVFYGYKGVYLPFEIKDIAAGVAAVRTLGIRGVSVTLPHKVKVMDYLDEIDARAGRIGAVNTIVNSDGVLSGHNTDVLGALEAFYERTTIKDKDVVIIGAGGAAKAIGHGIIENGGRLTVVNRSIDKGEKLAADLNAAFLPLAEVQKTTPDIMINTTPVGMQPDNQSTPIPKSVFHQGMTVMDIIYTPLKTRFLREAEAAGCTIINGLPMFIHQGACQFKLWTGLEAPLAVMRKAVLEGLKEQ